MYYFWFSCADEVIIGLMAKSKKKNRIPAPRSQLKNKVIGKNIVPSGQSENHFQAALDKKDYVLAKKILDQTTPKGFF